VKESKAPLLNLRLFLTKGKFINVVEPKGREKKIKRKSVKKKKLVFLKNQKGNKMNRNK